MTDDADDCHHPVLAEHRGGDGDVEQVAGAQPRVVGDHHVARLEFLRGIPLQHCFDRHGQGQVEHRHGARRMGDLLAVGIQHLAGEVLGLADDQRERRSDHGVPTLLGDVDQPAPHNLEPDGVILDACHRLFERHARRHHRLKGRGLANSQE